MPLLSLLILGLIMLYVTNVADYAKALRAVGLIYAILTIVFFAIIKDFNRRLVGNREKLVVWSAIYILIVLTMMVALSTFYGRTVYNDILSTIGGGAGSTISFITDEDNGKVLVELVPMSSAMKSQPIQLVRETTDTYLVLLSDQTGVSVDKDLVKGVIHHRTRGWELRPSVFD